MSSLILVRHCQATGQEPDALLTAAGQRQASELADFMSAYSVEVIVTSAYLRAQQTAQPLSDRLHLSVEVDPRLNERTLSPRPIDNWREVVRDSFADRDLRVPGGESANDVLGRAWPVLKQRLSGCDVLPVLVTHGNLLALVLHSIDPSFGYLAWENLSNPDVYRVEVDGDAGMSFRRLWNP